ncbi:unnamed protein product, partial [Amoebophrya sp. A120]
KHQRQKKHTTSPNDHAVSTAFILATRNSQRHQLRQEIRKANFPTAYSIFAKKLPAPLNIYHPSNYVLLAKWLTIKDGRKRERTHDLDVLSLRRN